MRARKLTIVLAAAGVIAAAVPASSSAAPTSDPGVAVCNEAENSFRGGYVVTDSTDPVPPAFLRGEQMRVGHGHGTGLVHAAERAPALALCAAPGGDDDAIPCLSANDTSARAAAARAEPARRSAVSMISAVRRARAASGTSSGSSGRAPNSEDAGRRGSV